MADVTHRVSACVVTYNSVDDIAACLAALAADTSLGAGAVEVIVVDNASTDGTREVLDGVASGATVLLPEVNTGFAEGNNLAVRASSAPLLLILNPDCTVEPGCLRSLVDTLEADPERGAVAAMMTYPDGRPQTFARRDRGPVTYAFAFTFVGRWVDRKLLGDRHRRRRSYDDRWPPTEVTSYDTVAAACLLVRRPDDGDLFDPTFPIFFNDADLFQRLRAAGRTIVVDPGAVARHGYGTSVGKLPGPAYSAEMLCSLLHYAGRHWSRPRRLALAVALLVDALVCAVLSPRSRWSDEARRQLRAILGAVGLPGGAAPWLARPVLRRSGSGVARARQR